MSFGLSGDPLRNQMIGADVVVAWIDQETLNGYAVDYYLTDKSQCAGGRGSCPDSRIQVKLQDFVNMEKKNYEVLKNTIIQKNTKLPTLLHLL